jgi:hypothetical protein
MLICISGTTEQAWISKFINVKANCLLIIIGLAWRKLVPASLYLLKALFFQFGKTALRKHKGQKISEADFLTFKDSENNNDLANIFTSKSFIKL